MSFFQSLSKRVHTRPRSKSLRLKVVVQMGNAVIIPRITTALVHGGRQNQNKIKVSCSCFMQFRLSGGGVSQSLWISFCFTNLPDRYNPFPLWSHPTLLRHLSNFDPDIFFYNDFVYQPSPMGIGFDLIHLIASFYFIQCSQGSIWRNMSLSCVFTSIFASKFPEAFLTAT